MIGDDTGCGLAMYASNQKNLLAFA